MEPAAPAALAAASAAAAPSASGAATPPGASSGPGSGGAVEVKVPDIGDFAEVAVIEVMVKAGDAVKVEQSLITVESDKASMEIPSSHAGVVKEVKVKVGDKVSEGTLVAVLEGAAGAGAAAGAGGAGLADTDAACAGRGAASPSGGRSCRACGRRAGAAGRRQAATDGGFAGARADCAPGQPAARFADDPKARPPSSVCRSRKSRARGRKAASPRKTSGVSSRA
jgi:pyruvate/2-oxoglutarate dehydrogenase complex dihydrolipoamide acyltransferase (E2) component